MLKRNHEDMTIEEINTLIAQNSKEIYLLQEKFNQKKIEKEKNFQQMLTLINELGNYQQKYYDFRAMLGSPFFTLSESERETIELIMPIYEQKIEQLKNELKDIKIDTIF